ncbi:MAG: RimK family alpha-L-glutamate ligase [Candidatus Bathyarchaeia archaeon]|nr:RimK family alpha-L-glutamate ligase [Candidatus Bathyarchaeota archaeon]
MEIGLLTRNYSSWCSSRLISALSANGVKPFPFSFRELSVSLGADERFYVRGSDLAGRVSAILVRPIGRGSLEEIIFQLDALHALRDHGIPVVNDPDAIEVAADKYRILSKLRLKGLPVPESIVTEDPREASRYFSKLGGDVLIKPVFGSRGIGISRVKDRDVADRIFRTLRFYRHVLLLQKFIPHGTTDIRAFVVGGRVIAAMRRRGDTWRTNISQGARAEPLEISGEMEELALKAADALGCEIAGVDLLEGREGIKILEVNSQPGWRGLQSVAKVDIADEIAKYMIQKGKGAA